MKLLIVGSDSPYAIERYFVKYLREMGVEINHFPSADIIFNYHSKNFFNKILFRTKIKTRYGMVNKKLLMIAYSFKPDIIWIFKGMEIYPETLKLLNHDFKLANYNPDHPFLITSRGSGNKNVRDSVGLYHLHFCYHNELLKHIENEFKIHSVFLPFAYDGSDIVYRDPSGLAEIKRICFQANPDAYRVKIVQMFTEAGMEIDVYGVGWDKTGLNKNKRVRIFEIATRSVFWKLNQQYRVQLNLFRQYNMGSHNMRTFEIPAVGGIQLAPYSEEQAMFFKDGKEIFFFRDDKEMLNKAMEILAYSDNEARKIRDAARSRSLRSAYTFEDRSQIVYNAFKEMIQ